MNLHDSPFKGPDGTAWDNPCYRRILLSAAPVYAGIKPAELLCKHTDDCGRFVSEHISAAAERLGLEALVLYRSGGFVSVLFYRSELLWQCLAGQETSLLLRRAGYSGSTEDMLRQLRERYNPRCFPHEIGLFLGYPPEDVEGYIANRGQNYKLCRYWKVYGSITQALELFMQIDAARQNFKLHVFPLM